MHYFIAFRSGPRGTMLRPDAAKFKGVGFAFGGCRRWVRPAFRSRHQGSGKIDPAIYFRRLVRIAQQIAQKGPQPDFSGFRIGRQPTIAAHGRDPAYVRQSAQQPLSSMV